MSDKIEVFVRQYKKGPGGTIIMWPSEPSSTMSPEYCLGWGVHDGHASFHPERVVELTSPLSAQGSQAVIDRYLREYSQAEDSVEYVVVSPTAELLERFRVEREQKYHQALSGN